MEKLRKGLILYDKAGLKRNIKFRDMLKEHAAQRGFELITLIKEKLMYSADGSILPITIDGTPFDDAEFAVNRIFSPEVSEKIEALGIPVFNSSNVSRLFNDKRLTYSYYKPDAMILPHVSLYGEPKSEECEELGYPLVVKSPNGHGGKEVFWVVDKYGLEYVLKKFDYHAVVQKVADTPGRDLRVYVLDKKPIAFILRSNDRSFRSNFSLGGKAEVYEPSAYEAEIIQGVINHLPSGALYVGVDFLFHNDRIYFNEAEDVVGSRMLYSVTKIQPHELLIDKIIDKINGNI